MENHTGRIYEVLKLLNGVPTVEMREILHEAWPVYFQITKLSESDYAKFKKNILRLLHQRGWRSGPHNIVNDSGMPEQNV